ncbi:acyl-CoA thioesterase [Wenzhouxiangella marina]|uniref:Acyl-CoA thioesterase 2 n=1 Tax=Wenzhouxiangella marina TaxID=1579979 RepID=A0A0K0XXF4_9GAMM|nr:acyl-CoA thioesterase II [Wenzhouxiangella marina]AKS42291.1 Palmitoyl-CoA hydrolase [Wenzhouxiangella marina]MBB6085936.1 acyl-CoA thioesterase-2 [Wenzhouxiangella marina]
MNPDLKAVIDLLSLERIEDLIFRGESHDIGAPQVFGGQILGQALSAASQTVDGASPHSLHAYFLRRGDFNQPVVYQVERSRDGRSYASRRVVAVQHGRPILSLAASFHRPESGFEHQDEMPQVPGPEGLSSSIDIHASIIDRVPEKMRRLLAHRPPFEFRPVEAPKFIEPRARPARKHVWMRAWDPLPDDEELHWKLLAYVSDYELLGTSTLPHDLDFSARAVQMASIDHALWFHRPFRVDEWLLFAFDSPSAHEGRGFSRGQIFSTDGRLVASSAQEGVIRPWNPPPPES